MNIASRARSAVSVYLETECTQEHFAELIGVSVEKLKAWEEGGVAENTPGAALLLKGIVHDTEFMLKVLVSVRLRLDLGLDVPECIALEIVRSLMKKNGPQMSSVTRFKMLRIITRAQLASEARDTSPQKAEEYVL